MFRPRHVLGALALISTTACAAGPPSGSPPASASEAAASTSAGAPSTAQPASPRGSVAPPAEATAFAPGVISTEAEEYRISFSADGQTAYFARGDGFFPQTGEATILETRLVDGAWSDPVPAAFSGTYPDIDPWLSPDGASLYFSSIRPVGGEPRNDAEVWRVDRVGDGWSEPVHLAALSSESDELGASVTADGVLWFASDRAGGSGGWDLYTAEPTADGGFAAPQPVVALNSPIWEFNPAISADGATLVFTSINRAGGTGLGDLFETTLADGEWTEPRPLAINTSADEYHASFSADGAQLYFVRRVGHGDLYVVDRP